MKKDTSSNQVYMTTKSGVIQTILQEGLKIPVMKICNEIFIAHPNILVFNPWLFSTVRWDLYVITKTAQGAPCKSAAVSDSVHCRFSVALATKNHHYSTNPSRVGIILKNVLEDAKSIHDVILFRLHRMTTGSVVDQPKFSAGVLHHRQIL